MKTPIIAVLGRKKSGKTKMIEILASRLSENGLKVATIKHIRHQDFKLDVEGKDTWRHMRAGASIVMGISRLKIAYIEKLTEEFNLNRAIDLIAGRGANIILLEGFSSMVANRADVLKIIMARNRGELQEIMDKVTPPIIAISGAVANDLSEFRKIPVISLSDESKIIELVKKSLNVKRNN
ncbi:molybdopterin-guanine dinucleotide biosynthesis protein B [Candidatus Geothermarchaeota archaeon]|nr:MAG: molybdopterin-guanine dinucleotide biosynthesis protein B [Candidatus Geothermarchaeota archaeon]